MAQEQAIKQSKEPKSTIPQNMARAVLLHAVLSSSNKGQHGLTKA